MSTVGSYFAWARRAEGHRISALNYAKLYRFLSIEMSLPRPERMLPHDLLKFVKNEYDRLSEISPLIPTNIIDDFKKYFSDKKYDSISKPEDTNGLTPIHVYNVDDMTIAPETKPMDEYSISVVSPPAPRALRASQSVMSEAQVVQDLEKIRRELRDLKSTATPLPPVRSEAASTDSTVSTIT
jgi:hypothetical protein